jgi:hypothetical protein
MQSAAGLNEFSKAGSVVRLLLRRGAAAAHLKRQSEAKQDYAVALAALKQLGRIEEAAAVEADIILLQDDQLVAGSQLGEHRQQTVAC